MDTNPSGRTTGGATGPRTAEGKERSARNALKHGLTATKLDNAVDPELKEVYAKLRQQYFEEYKPTGAIENTLLDMVVLSAWQLYKIRELELYSEIDLGAPGAMGRSEKLARYRASHERLLFRSLNQLKQIQQERALLATARAAQLPAHIAPGVRVQPLLAHVRRIGRQTRTLTATAGVAATRLARAMELRNQRGFMAPSRISSGRPAPAA